MEHFAQNLIGHDVSVLTRDAETVGKLLSCDFIGVVLKEDDGRAILLPWAQVVSLLEL